MLAVGKVPERLLMTDSIMQLQFTGGTNFLFFLKNMNRKCQTPIDGDKKGKTVNE